MRPPAPVARPQKLERLRVDSPKSGGGSPTKIPLLSPPKPAAQRQRSSRGAAWISEPRRQAGRSREALPEKFPVQLSPAKAGCSWSFQSPVHPGEIHRLLIREPRVDRFRWTRWWRRAPHPEGQKKQSRLCRPPPGAAKSQPSGFLLQVSARTKSVQPEDSSCGHRYR